MIETVSKLLLFALISFKIKINKRMKTNCLRFPFFKSLKVAQTLILCLKHLQPHTWQIF